MTAPLLNVVLTISRCALRTARATFERSWTELLAFWLSGSGGTRSSFYSRLYLVMFARLSCCTRLRARSSNRPRNDSAQPLSDGACQPAVQELVRDPQPVASARSLPEFFEAPETAVIEGLECAIRPPDHPQAEVKRNVAALSRLHGLLVQLRY